MRRSAHLCGRPTLPAMARYFDVHPVDPQRRAIGQIVDLIAAAMRGADVHTDVVDAVAQAFRAADATGHGDEDMAAVVRAFRPHS